MIGSPVPFSRGVDFAVESSAALVANVRDPWLLYLLIHSFQILCGLDALSNTSPFERMFVNTNTIIRNGMLRILINLKISAKKTTTTTTETATTATMMIMINVSNGHKNSSNRRSSRYVTMCSLHRELFPTRKLAWRQCYAWVNHVQLVSWASWWEGMTQLLIWAELKWPSWSN